MSWRLTLYSFIVFQCSLTLVYSQGKHKVDSSLYHLHTITGSIAPKSVVHNGRGTFFAQNMMYKHTITVYNRDYVLRKTIKDKIDATTFGWSQYKEPLKGSPVECCFSPDGKYAFVSNYNMSGGGEDFFNKPGCDGCSSSSKYDSSFVYKVNTSSLKIESIIQVGSIPKYLASSPDGKLVLVTNWTSGDLSIIDVAKNKEIKRVKLGTFPRGIVIDSQSKYAYITIMGSYEIIKLNLSDYSKTEIKVGKGPRHLCISPDDRFLYLTLNSENRIGKLNLATLELQKVRAGHQPRSMTIDAKGKYLYVVNYNDANFTKFDSRSMLPIAITKTKSKPIGITYDEEDQKVWVACYSGSVQIFKDSLVHSKKSYEIPLKKDKEIAESGKADGRIANLSVADKTEEVKETKVYQGKKYVPVYKPVRKDFTKNLARFEKEKQEELLLAKKEAKELKLAKEKADKIEKENQLLALNQQKKKNEKLALKKKRELELKKSQKVDKIKETESHLPDPNFSPEKGKYLVVLGAFGKLKNVDKLRSKLEADGLTTFAYYNSLKKVTYVCAGQFMKESLAESRADNLKDKNYDCWVFKDAK